LIRSYGPGQRSGKRQNDSSRISRLRRLVGWAGQNHSCFKSFERLKCPSNV